MEKNHKHDIYAAVTDQDSPVGGTPSLGGGGRRDKILLNLYKSGMKSRNIWSLGWGWGGGQVRHRMAYGGVCKILCFKGEANSLETRFPPKNCHMKQTKVWPERVGEGEGSPMASKDSLILPAIVLRNRYHQNSCSYSL